MSLTTPAPCPPGAADPAEPLPRWHFDELPDEVTARAARRGALAERRRAAAAADPTLPARQAAVRGEIAAARAAAAARTAAVRAPAPQPRPVPSAVAEMDRKRTEALQMLNQGTPPHRIARLLGVSVSQVNRWDRGDR